MCPAALLLTLIISRIFSWFFLIFYIDDNVICEQNNCIFFFPIWMFLILFLVWLQSRNSNTMINRDIPDFSDTGQKYSGLHN